MRKRRLVAVAGLVALLGATAVHPPAATEANWVQREFGTASLAAPILPNVGAISCTDQAPNLLPTQVLLGWTPASALPAGATYEVRITKGTSTGLLYTDQPGAVVSNSTLDLLGFLLGGSGTATIAVRSVFRTSDGTVRWTSSASSTRTVRYTAPVLGLLLGGWTCS
jgi:hypothetical protein